jgi:hypothetical protein
MEHPRISISSQTNGTFQKEWNDLEMEPSGRRRFQWRHLEGYGQFWNNAGTFQND